MLEERSAGAVLFHRDKGMNIFLLLHYPAGHWDFPKGNIEKGESDLETVRREVKEETGISDITIFEGFKKIIEYNYRRNSSVVHKRVTYYLAESAITDVKISFEHLGYEWLNYNDSMKKLTFKNAKTVLEAANEFLKQKSDSKTLDRFVSQPPQGQKTQE